MAYNYSQRQTGCGNCMTLVTLANERAYATHNPDHKIFRAVYATDRAFQQRKWAANFLRAAEANEMSCFDYLRQQAIDFREEDIAEWANYEEPLTEVYAAISEPQLTNSLRLVAQGAVVFDQQPKHDATARSCWIAANLVTSDFEQDPLFTINRKFILPRGMRDQDEWVL